MKELNAEVCEAADYNMLDDMSVDEIIDELNDIDDIWLPVARYYGDDHNACRMHKALRLAIEILEKERNSEE